MCGLSSIFCTNPQSIQCIRCNVHQPRNNTQFRTVLLRALCFVHNYSSIVCGQPLSFSFLRFLFLAVIRFVSVAVLFPNVNIKLFGKQDPIRAPFAVAVHNHSPFGGCGISLQYFACIPFLLKNPYLLQ